MEEWARWLEAQGAGAWDEPEPIAQLAPGAEHVTLAERCLLSLLLIVTLAFNIQIYCLHLLTWWNFRSCTWGNRKGTGVSMATLLNMVLSHLHSG